jgi:hypothetical protein
MVDRRLLVTEGVSAPLEELSARTDSSVIARKSAPAPAPKRRLAIEPIRHKEPMTGSGVSLLDMPFPAEALFGQKTLKRNGIRKAVDAEDGHSLAEQAVYDALWQAAVPLTGDPDGPRTIRIGYHRLGQLTRLSWVSVKSNLRTLEKKLAIEVTGCENWATREGNCDLVQSRASILVRRKQAGLEWVRRTRGVELLSLTAIAAGRPGSKAVT